MKGFATMSKLRAPVALDVRFSGYDYPDNLDYLGGCTNSVLVVEVPGGGDARAVCLPGVGRRERGLSDKGTNKGTDKVADEVCRIRVHGQTRADFMLGRSRAGATVGRMKLTVTRIAVALCVMAYSAWAGAAELQKLKVLYVGDLRAARASEFAGLLKTNVGVFGTAAISTFKPEQAAQFDVVLLDWPQSGELRELKRAPLGERETWTKPTVLLGSAGLNLAVVWKVRGGSG